MPEATTEPPDPMLQFFQYEHLPPHLQEISRACAKLALGAVAALPRNAERTAGLRKLLEAKDCFVRARVFNPAGVPPRPVDNVDVTQQVLQGLARIEAGIQNLQGSAAADAAHEAHMANAVQQLQDQVNTLMTKVERETTVSDSLITLTNGIAQTLRDSLGSVSTLDELRQKVAAAATALDGSADRVAAAVVANTDVAAPAGGGQPPAGGGDTGGGTGQV